MRAFVLPITIGLLATGSAHASSFVVLKPMKEKLGPSMVMLGEPATPKPDEPKTASAEVGSAPGKAIPDNTPPPSFVKLSPSVIAMDGYVPPVTMEQVASIDHDDDHARRLRDMPMVIRGGIRGDAFQRAVTATPIEPAAGNDQAPQDAVPQTASQTPSARKEPKQPPPQRTPEPPPAPPPAPMPPAPPTRQPE